MLWGKSLTAVPFLKVDFGGEVEIGYKVTKNAGRGSKKGEKGGIRIRRGQGTQISLLDNLTRTVS